MKGNNRLIFALLAFFIFTASSCQAIGDIFKAGVWVGVIVVVLVVGIIFWLINKTRK
ncbi:MAG: phosphatidate cytidylyltransferase [Ginsengibacter sp.]